ncbi:hypothetical protein KDW98_32410 [Burkholderia vietnamiensis]|jgi:hypothetical protein|uniref:hypothetical protein n=1 Tax=Burkholderia vietnamiensis TaxID=60552 RepID=UPI000A5E0BA8|nr:hypothetical protein [Burkholderia vietnamiensis]MBR8165837.1 hypothetical protein [Burkholderia vietnamiensis]
MKTTRTRTKAQTPRPSFHRALDCLTMVTLDELAELCDMPERNQTGQEVEAIITPHATGYTLIAKDAPFSLAVVDENRQPVVFRSIEQALDRLSEIPYLLPMVKIDLAAWGRVH